MLRRSLLMFSLMLVFVLAVSACGKKQTTELPETDPMDDVATEPEPEPVVDESMNNEPEVEPEPMPVLEDVFFDYDKHALSAAAKSTLSKNADQLKSAESVMITIEGHCDERGTNAYNLALGEKRAKAAMDYLRSLGVNASRVKTVSYGEERPFSSGSNESAWSKNRRAHFVINS